MRENYTGFFDQGCQVSDADLKAAIDSEHARNEKGIQYPLMTLDLGLPAQIRAAIELLGLPNYNGSPALLEQAEKVVSDYLSEK